MNKTRILVIGAAILIASLTRLLPHPPNFTPLVAMALFGGALFQKRVLGVIFPLIAMFIADLFLGFHQTMWAVYLSLVVISVFGRQLTNKIKVGTVLGGSLASSAIFFIVTNFAMWTTGYYGFSFTGLVECYTMAIPFFNNALLGDLLFSGILFGGFFLAESKIPALAKVKA